ncbi:BLUF domain-containing protein [Aestuariivita sp.]|uniref:BLUF domain-containing protein n=1 Tax=Aestuariivita sp. TaxID=1872407 RepID=UPI00216BCA30|nr:BLUF domain-containing protein [Aestuariivita sp.]MCE8006535.1 BLUF domain-containing protein [Aestuariivita sp.]
MSLLQLTYASRPFGFDAAMLAGILLDARRCNARDGITGALIVRSDIYLQLLEGPSSMVEAAYDRIRRDDRHTDLRAVRRHKLTERIFPDWAMRDDPARSWIWSPQEVSEGAVEDATPEEVLMTFRRLRSSFPQ